MCRKKEQDLCMRWFLDLFSCLFSYAQHAFVTLVRNDFPCVCVHAIVIQGLEFQINHFDILPMVCVKCLYTADETTGKNKFSFDKIYHLITFIFSCPFFPFGLKWKKKCSSQEDLMEMSTTNLVEAIQLIHSRNKVNFNCLRDLQTAFIFDEQLFIYLLLNIIFNPSLYKCGVSYLFIYPSENFEWKI